MEVNSPERMEDFVWHASRMNTVGGECPVAIRVHCAGMGNRQLRP